MSKLYITYNEKRNRREYYSYDMLKSGPVYLALSESEIAGYFQKILANPLKKVREVTKNIMEVENLIGDLIIIDDVRVFSNDCDKHDYQVNKLCTLIKDSIAKENIKNYKRDNQDYKGKRVKRNRSQNKLVIGGISLGLAVTLLATGISIKLNKKTSTEKTSKTITATIIETKPKTDDITINNEKITYDVPNVNTDTVSKAQEKVIPEVEKIEVEVAFEDLTEDGKLEQTIEDCSSYMDYWIERYGLPRDVAYALCSQESGVLECLEQANGACGPMQVQLLPQHCEHYIVPVYKDGVPTGEYDEFWAADARKLDDPRLKGKPIKIIQNLEDNFQIGCAYLRRCIDRYQNIFIAVDAYNKGLYALTKTYEVCQDKIDKPLDYYKENLNDFSWTSIIPEHSKEVFDIESYGDPNYIWNVLRYLKTDTRGNTTIDYDYEGNYVSVDISNTNVYNNEVQRGM